MLKAAGYKVALVAGSGNPQYCKDLSGDLFFDHEAGDVEKHVVEAVTVKPFARVFCPIMSPDPIAICARIAGPLGDSAKNN